MQEMADGLFQLASLPDPIGEVDKMWLGAQGIKIGKVRVPLGVVGIIYEARPNVTADVAGICLKTGNAVLLRGSQSALQSNQAVVSVLQKALKAEHFPEAAGLSAHRLQPGDRRKDDEAQRILGRFNPPRRRRIDPLGGGKRYRPVLETGVGNCHVFVDESADFLWRKRLS